MPVPACLSIPTVAERLGVHVDTLRGWIRDGKGPAATRIGGRIVIREDRLSEWLDRHTAPLPMPDPMPTPAHPAPMPPAPASVADCYNE